jgi:hypothetical protein
MTAQFTHEVTQAQTTDPTARTGRGWLRGACHRIHLAVQEMNFASRRMVEVQAPWTVDGQWHRK